MEGHESVDQRWKSREGSAFYRPLLYMYIKQTHSAVATYVGDVDGSVDERDVLTSAT